LHHYKVVDLKTNREFTYKCDAEFVQNVSILDDKKTKCVIEKEIKLESEIKLELEKNKTSQLVEES
jgi:hypothetical protein